jgi:hypothetical protein
MDEPAQSPLLLGHFSSGMLFASLIWGSIGVGMAIYGKKQQSAPALVGGVAMIAVSYLVADPLWMSVASIALIVGVYFWSRRG